MVVPTMAGIYFVCTIGIIVTHIDQLPNAIAMVIDGAFNPTAAAGGFLGSSVMLAMRSGIARGIFSNESGLGSAPIVAAAAKTKWAPEQGLVSMTGTFIDTIIICTLTGLSLLVTGVWCGDLNGAAMTSKAFTTTYSDVGSILLMIGLSLFAFTTILGWNYYGERCVEYLVGVKGILPYRVIFIVLVACGPYLQLEEIWVLSDICNGLMAFPNLVALVLLSGVVASETKAYYKHLEEEKK
jgi:AGCS family alanine or glycine:cation symporter